MSYWTEECLFHQPQICPLWETFHQPIKSQSPTKTLDNLAMTRELFACKYRQEAKRKAMRVVGQGDSTMHALLIHVQQLFSLPVNMNFIFNEKL